MSGEQAESRPEDQELGNQVVKGAFPEEAPPHQEPSLDQQRDLQLTEALLTQYREDIATCVAELGEVNASLRSLSEEMKAGTRIDVGLWRAALEKNKEYTAKIEQLTRLLSGQEGRREKILAGPQNLISNEKLEAFRAARDAARSEAASAEEERRIREGITFG